MAGGKLSPRQKMINLMYLVFIAMLALNMSKEVLSAFGTINESLEESITTFNSKNDAALNALSVKASEARDQFGKVYEDANKISEATTKLYGYFENLKTQMEASVDDPKDYETMDKSQFVNELFFKNGKLKPEAVQFKDNMRAYRDTVKNILGDDPKYATFVSTINAKFSADDVKPQDGGKNALQDYMNYHFEGFPLISSITKITGLQNELKIIENEIFSSKLSGQLTTMASMTNYTTLLQSEVSAVYPGNKYNGSIVLGRTDPSTKPERVELTLGGRKLVQGTDYEIDGGMVKLNVPAGNPGEKTIEGQLIFLQDGKEVPVNVKQSFNVIPKPNSATVSADKMNVVYRGIDNPITVSMPGVSENNISVSVPGHNKTTVSASKHIIKPGAGKELTVKVVGTIDGQSFPSESKFRIKALPRPTPTIRGQIQEGGAIKLPRKAVEISPIGAVFEDFDFDLSPVVKRFTMSVPGQASVVVNGATLNSQAKKALNLARTGDIIQFFDIKADIPGAQVNVKNMPALLVQLTN